MLVALTIALGLVARPPAPVVKASPIQDSPIAVRLTPPHGTARLVCAVDRRRAKACTRRMRFKLGSGRHVVTAWAIGRTGRAGRKASVHVIVPTRAPDAVEVGGNPVGIAAVGNAIWVSGGSNGAVARVDAKQRQVEATVAIGGQLGGIAANAQAVWVSVFDGGTVARIDPSTNAVVGRVAVGGQPTGIAFGPGGSVWIGNLNGYVSRIDPASDIVTAQVMLPSGASALLPSAGLLWVGLQDGSLVAIDPAANALSGPAIRVSLDVDALTEAPGGLWVSTFGGNAALVDPSSRTVMRRVKLPSRGSGVAFANGVVWVSLYDSRLVVELDPTTGAFVGAIHTGAQPRESVAAAGQLWVTDQASGQVTPIPL